MGRVEDVDTDNNVAEICSGVYLYENGEDAEALAITDLNKVVYVVDDQTVGKVGGSNKIVAGILRDVLTDGTVAVEVGNIAGDGVDGVDGDDGVDGTSSYTYVAYASDDQGHWFRDHSDRLAQVSRRDSRLHTDCRTSRWRFCHCRLGQVSSLIP